MMAKLSRSQIRSVRNQVKLAREKALQESADCSNDEIKKPAQKRDSKGLSSDDRKAIRDVKGNLEKSLPKITWNYDVGDLVYLPNSSIGIIVKNNAVDMSVGYFETDMKKTMKRNKYHGQVYVVTSSGNQWYYPNQLKKLSEI